MPGHEEIFEKKDEKIVGRWWRLWGSRERVRISENAFALPCHLITRILPLSFLLTRLLSSLFPPRCLLTSSSLSLGTPHLCAQPPMRSLWANLNPSPPGLACPIPPGSLIPSRMARDPPRRCLRQQVRQPRCPACGKRFADILRHLNHRQSKCSDWFSAANAHHHHRSPSPLNEFNLDDPTDPPASENIPSTPPPLSQPSPSRACIRFPGAARIYGRAKTFLDRFNDDQFSEFRATNVYYPFSGKNEWELSSFLLSSGLSMRKIDEFLQLKMVSSSL